ncbi:MAG: DUF262 domain-containing protein [Caldilineaceae bacterium SB0661_bin_32]|uniref:DUF262 domain-containing protein n=1 Tax=Caldilineaceae bacterium SB0661_bin_32 TaxID=2605255 RepID=A0A6B1D4V0_9CHLR|nr:DUF262 domain-containing protein [Caldilineaceae bacterium SB0661_bin_32]
MPETIKAEELQLFNIFNDGYRFEIPDYQRPYAWTTEQTSELLDDLLYAMGRAENVSEASPYFLGSIVIIKEDGQPQSYVVDGQQRITTLTILFSVLRELAAESNKSAIDKYVYAPGAVFAGIPGHFRLTVRDLDKGFFQDNIQQMGSLSHFVKSSHGKLSDSQTRMLENSSYLWKSISKFDEKRRNSLMQFLVQRCYLVVVSTSDRNSAYRIFSVLNDRGLDLSPTDILKADIIGELEKTEQSSYTKKWEAIEEDLGREKFRDLFAHIRMIYVKSKLYGTLQQEIQDSVLKSVGKSKFVDQILTPYAEQYEIVTRECYESAANAESVNEVLRYLNRLDNFDWIPPALEYFKRYPKDTSRLLRFLRDLERLAYGLFIKRANINQRIRRYADVLQGIEQGKDLFEPESRLQLTADEKSEILCALDGQIYWQIRVRSPLLLRLDNMLADEGVHHVHSVISIEHVLPQSPRSGSKWRKNFTEDERTDWTNRLANLVLLSRRKNSKAQNYDFDKKKKEYFQKGGMPTFPLTLQVLNENEWTPEVLKRRQRKLLNTLKKEWRLE